MNNEMVSKIIDQHVKEFYEICDDLESTYGKTDSSSCARRIALKAQCKTYYEMLFHMFLIVAELGGYNNEDDEYIKIHEEVATKFYTTCYGL